MTAFPKVFASTACMAKRFATLNKLLDGYDASGIAAIEFGHSPPLADFGSAEYLQRYASRALIHNYFPPPSKEFVLNLAAQDARTLELSRAMAANALRLCREIGAPFYSVHCGFLGSFASSSLGHILERSNVVPYETGYATFAASLRQLLDIAGSCGVRLAIEPNVVCQFNLAGGVNDLLMMAHPAEFRRLWRDFSSPQLGVLVDLGHLNVTSRTLHFEVSEFMNAVEGRVLGFHVHDNDGVRDQHRPMESSWMVEILSRSEYRDCPIVVEAAFDHPNELADHIRAVAASIQGR